MSEMVERVARALCVSVNGRKYCVDHCGGWWTECNVWLGHARIAIAAMREPTKDMLHQGAEMSESAPSVWGAMIDAAIGEEKP